jgi:hypothetical protein
MDDELGEGLVYGLCLLAVQVGADVETLSDVGNGQVSLLGDATAYKHTINS